MRQSGRRFAEGTSVSVERSRAEIESVLHKYGCDSFGYQYNNIAALIEFKTHDRRIRFILPLPPKDDFKKRQVRGRFQSCTPEQQAALWEQACREKWRALALAIKAKLECVTSKISSFEDEFLAHTVDPVTGRTMGEILQPILIDRYSGRDTGQLCLPAPDTE